MGMTRPIVYLVEVPTPYRNAEMDRAAATMGSDAVQVLFVRAEKDGCFEYDLPRVCAFHVVDGTPRQRGLPFAEVVPHLAALRPGLVIVGGYVQPIARVVLAWCAATGTPFALRSDSNHFSDRLKGTARFLVRRWRLGRWVRRAHRILVTGTYNARFWRRYGMRPEQEGWWPQWVDYDHYAAACRLRSEGRQPLRERFGLAAPVQFLHVGRLIKRKQVDLLCEALLAADDRAGLAVAGSGPEEEGLRRRYAGRLGARLAFLGAVHQREMPALYAACDALAVASGPSEPWGMVLNEAAAAGLPIVCDHRVGAAGDLLVDGSNGLALPDNKRASWITAINRLAGDEALRRAMGEASLGIAAQWQARSEPRRCLGEYLTLASEASLAR